MKEIKVFAPSSVANVGPGYDILGFPVEGYGDTLKVKPRSDDQLVITSIKGAGGIPTDSSKNVSTVAVRSMLDELDSNQGFDFEIEKNIPPGSGLGSSASSSAAAVFAINELLGKPFEKLDLVRFAMKGERLASGVAHADNVAPSLMGGFTVVRSYEPLDIFSIPFPEDLRVAIIYPHVEVKTADAKMILKKQIKLSEAVTQWGNLAGLITGLITKDHQLIGRSMIDTIVEPARSILIPFYQEIKTNSMSLGALGFNISGSGPTMFALTDSDEVGNKILKSAVSLLQRHDIESHTFISKISDQGARVL